MKFKTKFTKVGDSYYLIVPKSIIDVYDLLKEVYTYEMEHRDAGAPRNNRIKPGKGLSSRYWRFTFRNVGGADFQIHDVAVELARSKRRL